MVPVRTEYLDPSTQTRRDGSEETELITWLEKRSELTPLRREDSANSLTRAAGRSTGEYEPQPVVEPVPTKTRFAVGDQPTPDATTKADVADDEGVLSETLQHLEQIDTDDVAWTGGSVDASGEALTARRRDK